MRIFYWIIVSLVLFSACENPTIEPKGSYEAGVFTINEGVFGQTSGTISHYNRNNQETKAKIFKQVNNRDLGDVVQSMYFHEKEAYIVVNNSNKIEVADANTFEEKAQILNLRLPRYFMPISSTKAYVTEWGTDGLTGTIAVLDLTTKTIVNRIAVEKGPERMLFKNGKVYITHVGGFGDSNRITIINSVDDQIETTLTVLDKPSACVEDVDGNIWVACSGKVVYLTYPTIDVANSTESGLIKIDPTTQTVVSTKSFGKGNVARDLIINQAKTELYYTRSGKVWKYIIATGIEEALFSGSFYGLGYDPNTNYIYAATASGVNSATIQRYQTNGTLVDSYVAGTFANGFVFK